MHRPACLIVLLSALLILSGWTEVSAADPLDPFAATYPIGHSLEGLPRSDAAVPAYSADPDHWLNQLQALLFVQNHVATEIGAALPEERQRIGKTDAEFYVKAWQFNKRKGDEVDLKAFGGDVKISALIQMDDQRRGKLLPLLENLSTREKVEAIPELTSPMARLMLQWDLLSVWWRFEGSRKWQVERTPENEVLLTAMARAIQSLALPKSVLQNLPTGLEELKEQFPDAHTRRSTSAPFLPDALFDRSPESPWVEVDRRSSVLFQGKEALRTSPTYLNAGSREASIKLVEDAAVSTRESGMPDVPLGTEVALIMTLVGIDETLTPVATPVLDEIRVRRISGPFGLSSENPTSSKDGVDHWLYYRSRPGTLLAKDQPFRFIPDTTQSLFLEYGTAKHTTFAAQCALCHRTEMNVPTHPKGISMLSPHGKPHVVEDPMTRFRLVETEMEVVVDALKARLSPATSVSLSK